ncbi:MAG: hypothetical protein L0Z73_01495 [Gammaproteobacteria bacterium]|nr:hypothetical protein [Gammaproteobacteria bacterium]
MRNIMVFVLFFVVVSCLPAPASISIFTNIDNTRISQIDIDLLVRIIMNNSKAELTCGETDKKWEAIDKYSKQFVIPTETKLSGAVIYVPSSNKLRIIFLSSTKEEKFSDQEKLEIKDRIFLIKEAFRKCQVEFRISGETI